MDTTSYGTTSATSPEKKKFIATAASKAYGGPSIVDYLGASGYGTDLASRSALGKDYGIDYSNTKDNYATQNTALLSALRAGGGSASDATSGTGPTSTPTGSPTGSPTGAPTGTTTGASAVDTAFTDYLNALKGTSGLTSAKTAYNDFIANRDQGINNIEGQGRGIPLSLVRGQQEKLYKQAGIEGNRLQGDITIAQDEYNNLSAAQKARYDYEQAKISETSKANPAFELSPGQERYTYDPKTGGYVKTASAAQDYKTVSAGSTLFDPVTGKPIYTAPKIPTPGSGNPTPTESKNAKIVSGEQKLNSAKGADGYTDPYLYKQAAEDWVNDRLGTIAQFLTKFPPKNYVNPEASKIPNLLPPYLQNNVKSSTGRTT